jgi:hypothetical protein
MAAASLRGRPSPTTHHVRDLLPQRIECGSELAKNARRGASLTEEAKQQVLGSDHCVPKLGAFLARKRKHEASTVVVPVHVRPVRSMEEAP